MKVLILGSGIIGVTTAYVLASRGYDVEVIDRHAESARETSYANGGQLSYSHAEPWANPGVFPKVFKWMLRDDAPLVLRPRADYNMIKWGLRFLSNCTQEKANANTITMLRLGLYSRQKLHQMVDETKIDFHYKKAGILHVFSEEASFEHAKRQADFQEHYGGEEQVKTAAECLELEPTLAHCGKELIGGIYANVDESGDIFEFTQKLAELCQKKFGVVFHYNTEVTKIRTEKGKVTAIATTNGDMTADRYVMSLGSYSSYHLRRIGIDMPIYPMKGYSITMPANDFAPNMSITDQQAKIVYSRLGDKLRIAGTAEFAGYNDAVRERRIVPIIAAVRGLFPKALPEDEGIITKWACLRPSTPDGPPIIGKTPYENLYMNTGHGTLGWTQGPGSAFLFADLFEGKETEIDLKGMDIERYL